MLVLSISNTQRFAVELLSGVVLRDQMYKLKAFAIHAGSNVGGHYYAFIHGVRAMTSVFYFVCFFLFILFFAARRCLVLVQRQQCASSVAVVAGLWTKTNAGADHGVCQSV